MPDTRGNGLLITGAALSGVAALLHLACIAVGASWYRLLGAGERMARLADAGHWYPTTAAAVIAGVLLVWALYALSGAGVIGRLPLRRAALCAITGIYLLRGLGFVALMGHFPGNTRAFWFWSSAICFGIGAVHFVGVRQAWARL
jgi:hypothetical protein